MYLQCHGIQTGNPVTVTLHSTSSGTVHDASHDRFMSNDCLFRELKGLTCVGHVVLIWKCGYFSQFAVLPNIGFERFLQLDFTFPGFQVPYLGFRFPGCIVTWVLGNMGFHLSFCLVPFMFCCLDASIIAFLLLGYLKVWRQ